MLLATILLLCPFPQIEGTAKAVTNETAAAVSDSTKDSSLSQPLPSAPEPKVKSDAEVASSEMIEPGYTPVQPGTPIKGVRNVDYASERKCGAAQVVVCADHQRQHCGGI